MGLILSLVQPVLGADGTLALKQGAHPLSFYHSHTLTGIWPLSLLLLVCFVAYDALLVCVFAHVCAHPLCCSIDDVYRSLVQLSTKTGESLDVCRTVESAVT